MRAMKNKNIGLYIHIPFRNEEVNYLQTNSYYGMNLYEKEYFDNLHKEMKIRNIQNYNIDSVYIGGGDPSCIYSDFITSLLNSMKLEKNSEITIEINPYCELSKIKNYIDCGVNRFSIKVFPFKNEKWDILIKNILEMIEYINNKGVYNINLDIYFAYKNQITELNFLKLVDIPHLSFYSLNDGYLNDIEEEELSVIQNFIKKTDYIHYEINHYCKKGYESKHNYKYWNLDEYIGIGLGASSFIKGLLYKNELEFEKYFDKINLEEIPCCEKDLLDGEKLEKTYIILKMGTKEGIDTKEYKEKFNIDFELKYAETLKKFISNMIIEKHLDNYRFTDKGMYLSNEFFIDVL